MKKLKEKIIYEFDNFMTQNPLSQILGLTIIVFIILLIGTIATSVVFRGENIPEDMQGGFGSRMWWNFMRVIDPGTITGDDGFEIRILSLFSTVGGILIFSILIGFLSSKIVDKLDELKKGRTKVIEYDHTIILGWSPKVFTIIRELIRGNRDKGKNVIVIMSEKNTSDMYDEIKSQISHFGRTKVICRSGNPIDLSDIKRLHINEAKSVIILSDESEDSDIKVIKTVLAITHNPDRKKGNYHIVTEIFDIHNKAIAEMVGKDELEITFTNDLISRLIVQTSRQNGLSIVYNELLSFTGSELYFIKDQETYGKHFSEVFYGYKDEIIIGYKRGATIYPRPSPEDIINENDELIVLKDTKKLTKCDPHRAIFDESIIQSKKIPYSTKPEKILILGWNKELIFIIHEINKYVKKGSKIEIVADFNTTILSTVKKRCKDIQNVTLSFLTKNYTNRETIENLHPGKYNSIIILTDELKGKTTEDKDANTLITLLFLREILNNYSSKTTPNIVSEMIHSKNKELAQVARINDFIISSQTVSMILAQISEQKSINDLYSEIFDSQGIEIYLKPIKHYIKTTCTATFYTLMKAAFEAGCIAFGYKLMRHAFDKDKNFGVVINPLKDQAVEFHDDDLLIVFSHE